MPATAVKPSGTSKLESEVEQQLSKVVRRIRTHDLLCGAFLLGGLVFGYVAAAIALDRWLDLPAWVRQLGFLGLLAALGVTAFYGVVRPMRRTVNPLYAAREIEETIEDAKNSLVNWVDLQDKAMSDGVRAVVAARAAKQFKDADLDKAGESKRLLWLGGSMAAMLVVLAALFMIFKPTVFNSLVGRALNPFSTGQIATRTQITIVDPKDGDLTVTAGQPVTIGVQIGGKIPDADAPDRLVVLLRHNQADLNADEVPLEAGASYREWSIRLPERMVQNGFWYRVKGGDAETEEHHVTVRPKPMFTDFDVKYEYPPYLNMTADTVRNPHLEAHRGTVVTFTAKANRTLKDGRAVLTTLPTAVPGEVVTPGRDSLRVRFTMMESGTYRVFFNSVDGETNADAPVYDMRVLSDQPPTVAITNPKDEQTALSINGTLMVDGQVGDDFGIDKVTLRARLVAPNVPVRTLKAKPFQDGQSFKRAADGTYPTAVEYKDSYPLDKLTDEVGKPVELKPDMTIEYWLEATDNCTVPEANVGKSKVQKVRLLAAPEKPMANEDAQKQLAKRKQDEANLQQQQKKKLDQEQRPAKPSPQQANAEQKVEGNQTEEKPAGAKADGTPMKPMGGNAGTGGSPETQPNEQSVGKAPAHSGQNPMPPMGAENPPMPDAGPLDKAADAAAREKVQRQAQDIQKKLDEMEQQPAEGKGNDQPSPDRQSGAGEKKQKPTAEPSDAKPAGEQKPMPTNADEKGGAGDPQEKQGPLGGTGGGEKSAPEQKTPMSKPDAPAETGSAAKKNGPPQTDQPGDGGIKEEHRGGDAKAEKPPTPGAAKKGGKPEDAKATSEKKGGPEAEPKPTGDGSKQAAVEPKAEGKAEQNPDTKPGERSAQDQPAKGNPWQRGTEKRTPDDVKNSDRDDGGKRQDQEKALKALNGDDQNAKEDARNKLDKEFGKDAREKVENDLNRKKKIADGLQSKDPIQKTQAEKELTDLQREKLDEQNGSAEQRKEKAGDAQTLDRKDQERVKDLNSNDPKRQEDAREELGKKAGVDAVRRAEELGKNLKSLDKDKQQGAQDELKKMQDQAKQKGQAQQQKATEDAVKDLAGDDEKKKQDARDALDKSVGKAAREKAERAIEERKAAAEQMQSKDPMQQAQGQEKANELQKNGLEQARQQQNGGKADEQKRKDLQEAAKDLNSNDPQKRAAAEKKVDEMVGQDARKEAQKLADDLKSGDKDRQRGAAEQVKKMQQEVEKQANADKTKGGEGEKEQAAKQQELEQAAQDVAGNDEAKKQAAREKLDKEFGKEAREKFERKLQDRKEAADDVNSNDPMRQARGQEKQEQLQREELDRGAKEQQPNDAKGLDRKDVEDALRDLNSGDEAKKQAAREKLDKNFGKGAAQEAEDLMKDMKSNDPARQKGEQDALKKMRKQADQHAKENPKESDQKGGEGPSLQEIEKLAKAAQDLKSPDDQKRKDAEKQLDEKLGEQARKQLQDQMKDDKQPSPEQLDALKKGLEQLAKNRPQAGPKGDPRGTGAPGNTQDNEGKPLDASKEFDKQAAELQLQKLKDIQDKKQAKKLGYTDEELKRFIEGLERVVRETPDGKDDDPANPKANGPVRPATNVGNSGRVESRPNGSQSTTTAGGVTAAPPGYSDAKKKFAEGATKSPKEK